MKINIEQLENEITLITLDGRLDFEGAQAIDSKFVFATTTKQGKFIVDLSQASFIASIGLRTLLKGARGQIGRGGKYVIVCPHDMVRKVLEKAGFQSFVPIYDDVAAAKAALAT